MNAFVFASHNTYFALHETHGKGLEMTKLFKNPKFARLASAFTVFGAALDVARAIEGHRMPPAGALKTLGINEKDFRKSHVL